MAIRQLSYPLEKLFLNNVGRHVILRSKRRPRPKVRAHAAKVRRRRLPGKTRAANAKITASRTAAPARQTMLQRAIGRLAR
jgi:hypothetical protein